jgi:glycosyltransferase involved in cell wall biosynthesis
VVLVLPDLPQFMDTSSRRRGIARWAKAFDVKLLSWAMHHVDGVISLTDETVTKAQLDHLPHMAIQGIVDEQCIAGHTCASEPSAPAQKRLSVLYAGGVSEEYGVLLLLDAFKYVIGDVRLDICGSGPLVGRVQSDARLDPRIRYLGVLPNQAVNELEQGSTMLVNPRLSNSDFVRYSFPSKLLEYMMSGRPVVSTVLPGIPPSYWSHLIPIRDEAPEGLAEVLNKVLAQDMQDLNRIGAATRAFAVDNVGSLAQGRRLWDFISTVAGGEVH